MAIKYLAMHHAGGLKDDYYAPTQHLTWVHINNAHETRWNFLSNLGYYGGYNFYVSKDGSVKQFRQIGEETTAQIGHNFDAVSICCAGNFVKRNGTPIETPTEAQKTAVKHLLSKILSADYTGISIASGTVIDVTTDRIHHHRFYQSGTECDCLPDDFWRQIVKEPTQVPSPTPISSPSAVYGIIDAIIALLAKLKAEIGLLFTPKVVGSVDRAECGGL